MIKFTLNGAPISFTGSEDLSLLTWLREEKGIVSAKNGCSGQGACGACLIEIDGKAALSCRTPMKMKMLFSGQIYYNNNFQFILITIQSYHLLNSQMSDRSNGSI